MRYLLVAGMAFSLALMGCTPSSSMRSIMDLGGQLSSRGGVQAGGAALNKAYRYLRVQSGKRVVYFALGYLDPHPEGAIEVWYSGEREVLRLQNGRVVGAIGTPTEWLSVAFKGQPTWSGNPDGAVYERVRDVSPGYRFGLRETLRILSVPPPRGVNLVGMPVEDLTWFQESAAGADDLPPTLYGVRQEQGIFRVVYSEICLAKDLCFSWQRWQPQAGS